MTNKIVTNEEAILRDLAKSRVGIAASNVCAVLSSWRPSNAREWEYATLLVNGKSIIIGASTGGVVQVGGDPFTPLDKQLNISLENILASINYRI